MRTWGGVNSRIKLLEPRLFHVKETSAVNREGTTNKGNFILLLKMGVA